VGKVVAAKVAVARARGRGAKGVVKGAVVTEEAAPALKGVALPKVGARGAISSRT
jgi:hypothetical protein